jgi:LPS O-antigen subunit length determinant protein (WzzB/FepE family)
VQKTEQEKGLFQTEEINLIKLISIYLERKFLVLGFTGVITILSILYANSITPTYQVTSSFSPSNNESMVRINTSPGYEEFNLNANFLNLLSSINFQKKVFLDGDYLTLLNKKNTPIDDVEKFILSFISSVSINPPDASNKWPLGYAPGERYTISMLGVNAEAISSYLNELVYAANIETTNQLIEFLKLNIAARIDNISIEHLILKAQQEQNRSLELNRLSNAAKIAHSMGISENNFKQLSSLSPSGSSTSSTSTSTTTSTTSTTSTTYDISLPLWYLYGEKALLEEIKLLEDSPNTPLPGLVALNIEKNKLESSLKDLDNIVINAIQLDPSPMVPAQSIAPNKRAIIILSIIGGFMMSIFLVIVMNMLNSVQTLSKQTDSHSL